MPVRRPRIAALENAARELLKQPQLVQVRHATVYAPSARATAFAPTPHVFAMHETLQVEDQASVVERGTASVSGYGRITVRGRAIRVRLSTRRVVIVTTREVGALVGAAAGTFANPGTDAAPHSGASSASPSAGCGTRTVQTRDRAPGAVASRRGETRARPRVRRAAARAPPARPG